MAASHYRLGNLVAIVDANGFSGSQPTSQALNIEPLGARFEAFGWRVVEIDGHDVHQLTRIFNELPDPSSDRPTCVVARTRKGKGVAMMEQAPQTWHLGLLSPDLRDQVVAEISGRMG
jgi:transketolase